MKSLYGKDTVCKFEGNPTSILGALPALNNYSNDLINKHNNFVNDFAYNCSNEDSNRLLLDSDLTKRDTYIACSCYPRIDESYSSTYCPNTKSSATCVASCLNLLDSYMFNASQSNMTSAVPFVIYGNTNTSNPYLSLECMYLPSGDPGNTWYYWYGSSYASAYWSEINYYYAGGHGINIPTPGLGLNCIGFKLYLIKYSEHYDEVSPWEHLLLEGVSNNFRSLIENYEYKVYGNGFIKDWVYNAPLVTDIPGEYEPWLKTIPGTTAGNTDPLYKSGLINIGSDLLDGYDFMALELAVTDLTFVNNVLGGLSAVTVELNLLTPVVPYPYNNNQYSTYANNSWETYEPIYIAPQVLTSSSYYYWYGKSWNEWYYNSGNTNCTGTRNMYGLFYLIPICHYRPVFEYLPYTLSYGINIFTPVFHELSVQPSTSWF